MLHPPGARPIQQTKFVYSVLVYFKRRHVTGLDELDDANTARRSKYYVSVPV